MNTNLKIIGLMLLLAATGGCQTATYQQTPTAAVPQQSMTATPTQANAGARPTSINAKDSQGKTPLMLAAETGDTQALRDLLSKKADISIVDNTGQSALDYARSKDATDCIDLLFDATYPANTAHNGDSKSDIEIIEDATRFKLAGLALAPGTPGIGKLELLSNGRASVRPPPWAGKFDDVLSKARTAFLTKYGLDPNTSKIDSNGSLTHIGTRADGNDILVYMDMGEWTDIISVTPPSTKFLPVKLKSGLMTMRLPSLEVSFVEGAVCSVNGNRYTYRNGQWTANQ